MQTRQQTPMFKEKKPYFTSKRPFKSAVQIKKKERAPLCIIEKKTYVPHTDKMAMLVIKNRDLIDDTGLERIDDDREFEIGRIVK